MANFKIVNKEDAFNNKMLEVLEKNNLKHEIISLDLLKDTKTTIDFVYNLIIEIYQAQKGIEIRNKIQKSSRTDTKWLTLAYMICNEDWKEGYDLSIKDGVSLNSNSKHTRAVVIRRICKENFFFTIKKRNDSQFGELELIPTELTLKIREFIKGKKNFKISKRYLVVFEEE